jgi:single-strand DNA-binding protein
VLVVGRLRARSWETPEGERRSVVEVEADEVGASLKFAQARLSKPKRDGSGPARGGEFADEPPF